MYLQRPLIATVLATAPAAARGSAMIWLQLLRVLQRTTEHGGSGCNRSVNISTLRNSMTVTMLQPRLLLLRALLLLLWNHGGLRLLLSQARRQPALTLLVLPL